MVAFQSSIAGVTTRFSSAICASLKLMAVIRRSASSHPNGARPILPSFHGEAGIGDGEVEVLGGLVFADHLADLDADRPGAGEPAGLDAGDEGGEQLLGGGQQVLALAGAVGGQHRVAAGDQPLAGDIEAAAEAAGIAYEQFGQVRALRGVSFLTAVALGQGSQLQQPLRDGQGGFLGDFGKRGVGVDRQGDVFGRSFELHRQGHRS